MEFFPSKAPRTIEETDLDSGFLINLVAKIMNEGSAMVAATISETLKLSPVVVRQLLKEMLSLQMIESRGLENQDIRSDIRYALTDRGRALAFEAALTSQYVGAAPVTLEAFWKQIQSQTIKHEVVHRAELEEALSHLVLPNGIISQLGPAANSGRSVLLYGEAGNGKTSIAEALGKVFKDEIYVPHAILVRNQVIRFFDETAHHVVEMDHARARELDLDGRWVRIKRPVIVTGGELTLDMLDLQFDQRARLYEMPMHLKALGGVFVVDDFGRQRSTPTEILNRWIVPLESRFDILSLHTGQKFKIPFDQLVIFSTNIAPQDLADDASLRRLYFKIFVPSPTKPDYVTIFTNAAKQLELPMPEPVISGFFDDKYLAEKVPPSGAHPGFLLTHVLAACSFLGRPPEVTRELLDLAWKNVAFSGR